MSAFRKGSKVRKSGMFGKVYHIDKRTGYCWVEWDNGAKSLEPQSALEKVSKRP
jgi:preprotein translocase subunit YajC